MKQNIPSLNIFVSFFYTLLAGFVLYSLKLANKPLMKYTNKQKSNQQEHKKINYTWLIVKSWLKKYTFFGTFLLKDKKPLLKQFLFFGTYAITCLNVNSYIIWPLGLSVPVLIFSFVTLQLTNKLREIPSSELSRKRVHNQLQDQINQNNNILDILDRPTQTHLMQKQTAKLQTLTTRSKYQTFITVIYSLISVLLIFRTIYVISNSISNSGQLNIASFLIIVLMDQSLVRIFSGIIFVGVIKGFQHFLNFQLNNSYLIKSICEQQLQKIALQQAKQRIKKLVAMGASPPKKKVYSPSKIPKAIGSQNTTVLNLLSLQATRRVQQQCEGIQQVYLTTIQQQMFEGKDEDGEGSLTKRKKNKQNQQHSFFSAINRKHLTIQEEDDLESIQIVNNPLHQKNQNQFCDFYIQSSPVKQTKRKINYKKKPKRNLNLTGSSPYLQYLPNMLKNVDKFKQSKQNQASNILASKQKLIR